MLSRLAESLYWIGRNIERAEDLARAVDVTYHAILEESPVRRRPQTHWEALLEVSGDPALFSAHHTTATARNVVEFLTFSPHNPNSILSCVAIARENARGLRDRISSEMWESLNTLYLWLNGARPEQVVRGNVHEFYQRLKERCHLFDGITDNTMLHDEGWSFLQAGRYLERADMTARLLQVKYAQLLPDDHDESAAADVHQWIAMLKSVSAYEAYRKTYHPGIAPAPVCEFLIFSRQFPRSVAFSVNEVETALHHVSGSPAGRFANDAERLTGWLSAELTYGDINGVFDRGLNAYLEDVQTKCNRIGDAIAQAYFVYRIPRADEA